MAACGWLSNPLGPGLYAHAPAGRPGLGAAAGLRWRPALRSHLGPGSQAADPGLAQGWQLEYNRGVLHRMAGRYLQAGQAMERAIERGCGCLESVVEACRIRLAMWNKRPDFI